MFRVLHLRAVYIAIDWHISYRYGDKQLTGIQILVIAINTIDRTQKPIITLLFLVLGYSYNEYVFWRTIAVKNTEVSEQSNIYEYKFLWMYAFRSSDVSHVKMSFLSF